jgi:MazG family protein
MLRDLRRRCAWDRAQTRETLRPYLIEEVFELDHALGEEDPIAIREEVADLLLHLAWQLVLGEERGEFTASDIADDLEHKMRRRHPHLFELGPARPWEHLKRAETRRGTLEGLPPGLPELLLAYRLQQRAATVGFDWPDAAGPLQKVKEEVAEVEQELSQWAPGSDPSRHDALAGELGDLLFAVVNLARKAGVAPGPALDRANRKFRVRFERMEQLAAARGIEVATAGLTVLDGLWDEVKGGERETGNGER